MHDQNGPRQAMEKSEPRSWLGEKKRRYHSIIRKQKHNQKMCNQDQVHRSEEIKGTKMKKKTHKSNSYIIKICRSKNYLKKT